MTSTAHPDLAAGNRVLEAMVRMRGIDITAIEAAGGGAHPLVLAELLGWVVGGGLRAAVVTAWPRFTNGVFSAFAAVGFNST